MIMLSEQEVASRGGRAGAALGEAAARPYPGEQGPQLSVRGSGVDLGEGAAVNDNYEYYARFGTTCTLCEFVTGLAYAMEASGGLDDGLSDRMDDLVAPVRTARDWLWHVGQLMSQTKPLPSDFDRGVVSAEERAREALPKLKALIGEACDTLSLVKAPSVAVEPQVALM